MTALSTMVAGIAHEINTPVGISVTASSHARNHLEQTELSYKKETLSEENLKDFFENSKEAFDIIEKNLTRTSQLVKSFKQVSVDQTMDEVRTIDVHDYLKDLITSLRPVTKKSSIDIQIKCPKTLFIEINPGAFGQIITNLITNAVNHAFDPEVGGNIKIVFETSSDQQLHMTFSDNGSGIPEKNLKHIFDPFFTTKRSKGGTGLGLHILHNLVTEKLKGKVFCQSQLDQGTMFEISFPCTNCSTTNS
ncbi:sensor histidine kinase [Kiloniella majae]|uniref:sensor histidine kinase n=1 Tax=Kiloniella majae TaxID=1938558 RepID=UPI000A276E3D|nr:HAMP domain-containing sensor histidine kinase [Kiloniella majae]